jgi:hypothetical protein
MAAHIGRNSCQHYAGDVALKEIVAERALTVLAAAHEARGSGEVRKQPECSMSGGNR